MNEVFTHAAFGQLPVSFKVSEFAAAALRPSHSRVVHTVGEKHRPKPPAPYSIFDKTELENRVVRRRVVGMRQCGLTWWVLAGCSEQRN